MTRRLRIFARGNVDVHDTLIVSRHGDRVVWNGINELLRDRGFVARVIHETAVRSDVLARLPEPIPAELAAREPTLDLAAFPLATQFATQIYDGPWDAIILSIVQDAMTGLFRHRSERWAFFGGRVERWTPEARTWGRGVLESVARMTPDESAVALEAVIARIRERSPAPILVFNASSYIPGEAVHCLTGLPELESLRFMRFNLALAEVARRTGISIIDVDRVLAGAGAKRLKVDALHCTAEGHRLICEEVVRVLEDVGVFDH